MPSLRNDFGRLFLNVEFYEDNIVDFKLTSKEAGSQSEKTKTKRKDLLSLWENINGNKPIIKIEEDIVFNIISN